MSQAQMHRAVALAADVVVVLGFAAAGRSTHEVGNSFAGTLTTAMPFLLGLLVGWAVLMFAHHQDSGSAPALVQRIAVPWSLMAGILVWASSVILGLTIRVLLGDTAAMPFIMVAVVVLGSGLLGWRLIVLLVSRVNSAKTSDDRVTERI